jgi:hypothetical protein
LCQTLHVYLLVLRERAEFSRPSITRQAWFAIVAIEIA